TQTLKESYNETINGKEEVTGCVVKLTVQPIDEAESVVVKQMNGKDQVIASTTYKKKDFNEKTGNVNVSEYEEKTLKLQKATEYLIVEEHVIDEEKNKKVNRSIVVYDAEEEDNEIACNFANKDGVIDTRLVNLVK
ncbi:MAG: hypothetical protein Q4G58_01175, partial [bacterium]|nr:hypothetical protein [bacterium]